MVSTTLQSGTVINDLYVVRNLLGDGVSSEVYRVTTVRSGWEDADMALKLYRAKVVRPKFVERFRREMRLLFEVKHPHVIRCLDSGLYQGDPYFVLEYATGGCLRNAFGAADVVTVPVASWIIYQALAGLRAGRYIHRDIKPDNLFIMQGTNTSRSWIPGDIKQGASIKVGDWGLSRDGEADASEPRLTLTEEIAGTPWYMSPEQCFGSKFVGHAGDMYALGITMYELLCGTVPFDGESSSDVMHHQVHTAPQIPVGLQENARQVLSRVLSKDPSQRYPTLGAFQRALVPLMGLPDDWVYAHNPPDDLGDSQFQSTFQVPEI